MASSAETPSHPLSASGSAHRPRSSSRPRSRPTTPLRRSSKASISGIRLTDEAFPLNALEGSFAELSDSIAMLDQNFEDMQMMHQSLSRFSENFASFLYGLNMNAFCVDFPEQPLAESFKRNAEREERNGRSSGYGGGLRNDYDGETTFMTTDTSFVNEPAPPSAKQPTPTPLKTPARRGVPRVSVARGGRAGRGASGIARGRGISYR